MLGGGLAAAPNAGFMAGKAGCCGKRMADERFSGSRVGDGCCFR